MRKILLLLVCSLVSINAYAEDSFFQNEAQATRFSDAGTVARGAVDSKGNLFCSLIAGTASATNPIKLEDSAHTSGDAGIPAWAIRNEGAATLTDSNLDYSPIAVNREGAIYVSTSTALNDGTNGKLAVVDEDTAFAASDALTKMGAVNNRAASTYNTTQGDVTPLSVNDYGSIFVDLSGVNLLNPENTPVRLEDAAFGSANGVMVSGGQSLSAIAQSVGTSGDVAPIAMDLGNRTVVTNAPAGETWYSCSSVISTTARTAIKAAVASNRIYVTDITCINNATTPSYFTIEDGTTAMSVGFFGSNAAAGAYWEHTFNTPLRGTSNTALNVSVAQTGTSSICCAAGYISTI